MGIELGEEAGNRINRIGGLIDEFHEKMAVIYPPSGKRKRKGKK
jgi:hypothetical protein